MASMPGDLVDELRCILSDLQRSGEIPTQVPMDDVTECDDLGSLGIDSVARISLQASIEERWGVVLDDEHFQSRVTLQQLATHIGDKLRKGGR
jgi:acyl carrier protein